jgi:hypothetical protein
MFMTLYNFLDLEEPDKSKSWLCVYNTEILTSTMVVTAFVEIFVYNKMWGSLPLASLFTALWLLSIIGVIILITSQRRLAINTVSKERRLNHVTNIVFPAMLSVLPPVTFLTAEMLACDLKRYFVFRHAGAPIMLVENDTCGGIFFGVVPLLALLMALTAARVVFVNVKSPFTLENICRLKLSLWEGIEVVLFGCCTVYALIVYACRRERTFEHKGLEGKIAIVFGMIQFMALVFSGVFKKAEEQQDDEDLLGAAEGEENGRSFGSASTAGSRSSAARASTFSENRAISMRRFDSSMSTKNIWEGGTKGAVTKGEFIKPVEERGVAAESANVMDSGGGLASGEMAFNPGYL